MHSQHRLNHMHVYLCCNGYTFRSKKKKKKHDKIKFNKQNRTILKLRKLPMKGIKIRRDQGAGWTPCHVSVTSLTWGRLRLCPRPCGWRRNHCCLLVPLPQSLGTCRGSIWGCCRRHCPYGTRSPDRGGKARRALALACPPTYSPHRGHRAETERTRLVLD